jgi:UDP-3-O-[3-hydroxymyristoyl] glucosamine N-acyltransferase
MRLTELCLVLGGVLEGEDCVVSGVGSLLEAQSGDVSFLANPKYASQVQETQASVVLVGEAFEGAAPCALIRVGHVDAAFAEAVAQLGPKPVSYEPGIDATAVIAADAILGEGVCVGPYCVVASGVRIGAGSVLVAQVYVGEDVQMGEGCLLYPGAKVRESCELGNRVILQCGAVVGSDGFGYAPVDGTWQKIPQVGVVVLADDVEIGANATIDRARFGRTYIGTGTKIDNMVQIAHNVQVGEHSAMAAQTAVAGSTRIGNHVQFGGQSGAAGHLEIPDGTIVGAGAGVISTVKKPGYLLGMPAVDGREFMRRQAALGKVSGLIKRVRALERELASLKEAGSEA